MAKMLETRLLALRQQRRRRVGTGDAVAARAQRGVVERHAGGQLPGGFDRREDHDEEGDGDDREFRRRRAAPVEPAERISDHG